MEIISYIPSKYKWWELFFGRYQIARRMSGCYWVRMRKEGYSWVKMDKKYFESLHFLPGTEFDIEDYT